jgi:hypothetical protein
MRNASLTLLAAAVAVLAAGCAPNHGSQTIGSDPRDVGVVVPPGAEDVPLFSSHGLRGCRMRIVGDLTAGSLLGLRDQAHQKLAHAVIDVRRQTEATAPPRTQTAVIRPAAISYYTGTAVRFTDPACLQSALSSTSRLPVI